MGLLDIDKPLSTVISSAVNKSQQHCEKKILEMSRIETGAAGREAKTLSIELCDPLPLDEQSLLIKLLRYLQVSTERAAQQQAAEEEQQPQAVWNQHLAVQHEEDGRADAWHRRRRRRRSRRRRIRKPPHRSPDEDEAEADRLCKFHLL